MGRLNISRTLRPYHLLTPPRTDHNRRILQLIIPKLRILITTQTHKILIDQTLLLLITLLTDPIHIHHNPNRHKMHKPMMQEQSNCNIKIICRITIRAVLVRRVVHI